MKIRYYFLLITFFILGYLYSCKKDFARHADVITGSVDVVTAIAHGRLTDLGSKPISDHGFVWDSISIPGITGKKLQLGGLQNTGDFQGKLPDLLPNKTYYFKAFIIYNQEAFYGDMVSFATPDLPTLTTLAISEISQSTAKSGGNITNDGGAPVTAYGVCWSITVSPDLTGFHTIDGTGTGTYTSNLTSLAANTIYHVRAYATNNYGTKYGNEVVFNTGQSSTSPIVNTTDVSGITQTAAQSGGEVVSDGGSPVTQRGVCWSSTPYPTTSNNHSSDGSGTGIFTSSITALTPGTTYYLRAFATNSVGTSFGSEKSFMTLSSPGFPSVTTAAVTNITASTATSGGVVLSDGGATVTQRGVCWSTNPNPTTTDNHTSDGSGVGSFTSSVTGLTATITYHIRAYAINSTGTAYGNEISFTAGQNLTSPTVTTIEVVNILQTTATCGGNVTSDGGATVTLRGICWSNSTNPTTSDSKTQDGSGTGGYLSSMTGLTAITTYHVRAYAINSVGTSYGNEKVFTTLAEQTPPSVSTAPITNITNNSSISGGTVTSDGGSSVTARGVCWSISANPTITNSHTTDGTGIGGFVSNVTGLNGNTIYYLRAYATNSKGTTYGNQETFTTLQNPALATVTTTDATAITQTTATSGGNVTSDGGSAVTSKGVCWSTSANPTTSNSHTTDGSGTGVFVSSLTGLSPNTVYYVRAYAVNSVGTAYGNQISFTTLANIVPPTVITTAVTNITQTTATSGGNVTSDGGATVTARGVCWSTTSSPTIANSHTTDGSGTGTFVSNLTGLSANTLYYVRAYATNSVGTAYGNEVTFTTLPNPWQCGDTINYSGQVYHTILIGTQCWMKENLNIGTMIPGSQNQTNNSIIEKYCYNNDPANCGIYGGLYQWDEMMQYVMSEGAQGICPTGWHLPTQGEYTTIINDQGGWNIAGGAMKETGFIHWSPPNTAASNGSGFTGFGGGINDNTTFQFQLIYGYYWSSSQSASNRVYLILYYDTGSIGLPAMPALRGLSVRCVKN